MGSFNFGFGATFGNKAANLTLKLAGAFLVAGALRSGFHELAEEHGEPDDGINFVPGIFKYGAKNVQDMFHIVGGILDAIKDDPKARVEITPRGDGTIRSVRVVSSENQPI